MGELNSKLQVLINNCIRFIFNVRKDVHMRLRLKWLLVRNRRLNFLGCTKYRILHSPFALYLTNFSNTLMPRNIRHVRYGTSKFTCIPPHRASTFAKSFLNSSLNFRNSLPQNIRDAASLSVSKKVLYAHLYALDIPGIP